MSKNITREEMLTNLTSFLSPQDVKEYIQQLTWEQFSLFVEVQKEYIWKLEQLIQDFIEKVVFEYYNKNEVVIWTGWDGYKVISFADRIIKIIPYQFILEYDKKVVLSSNTSFLFDLDRKTNLLEKLVY